MNTRFSRQSSQGSFLKEGWEAVGDFLVRLPGHFCSLFLFVLMVWGTPAIAFQESGETRGVYVSSISWHTGIVVPAEVIPDSLWTEGHDYSRYPYLEIGWGEADYYPNEGFHLGYALKSVFWPTSSVLHINPKHGEVERSYYDTKVVRIEMDREQLQDLGQFLVESFELDGEGKIIPVAEGKFSASYFYAGRETYFFPKNSNVWAARAIKSAGFSLTPVFYQTTGMLLNKLENFGELVVEER